MREPPKIEAAAVEALLCDADGCLFPSEGPAFAASAGVTNDFLAAIGASRRFSAEELRLATTGRTFRTTAAALAEEEGLELDPAELESWVRAERSTVTAHLGKVLRPDPTVVEPLTRLARTHVLAAVSSSATVRLDASLAATGLDGLFPREARFSADDSLPRPSSKPDPAIYRFAIERLGIPAARCLAVEDSLPGVEAAVGAGLETLGNVVFVPEAERPDRIAELRAAGVAGILFDWEELAVLLGGGDSLTESAGVAGGGVR
jgi:beta-phosphoglucomutase-like phosphatase (HAD superfamily)